jgi:glucose-6-phosphate 1-dehydrogenase
MTTKQGVPIPDDHVIVIFGATGDLAKRKLLPGLFHLANAGLLPKKYRIIGSSPANGAPTDEQFRQHAKDAVAEFGLVKPEGEAWDAFEQLITFGAADPDDPQPLVDAVAVAEKAIGGHPRRLFHLAIPPVAAPSVVELLGSTKLATRGPDGGRVIAEKPFGTDLASAKKLNATFHSVFDESQIFRIDHFLGKESVDNILVLRFANGLMEPIWNRDHISYVQIDVPEAISIEGRASFYEQTGAFRDMVVTHLFQVLSFVAIEPPTALAAEPLRDEKAKVYESMKPIDVADVVRGQYDGYRSEQGVNPDSDTETFVALKVEVDNWRWAGVPFYLRTGKSLGERRQTVTIGFRRPPMRMFRDAAEQARSEPGNRLMIDFDDPGWISARFLAKVPGPTMSIGHVEMTFQYDTSFSGQVGLEGYERLILDAMLGDQSLFTTANGIERLWEVSTPLLEHPPPVQPYAAGSWGPDSINKLIAPHHWALPDGR